MPSQSTLVDSVSEWLVDQALGSPDIVEVFEETCKQLYAVGIPVARAMVTWPTLHPVVEVESAIWRRGRGVVFEQIYHASQASENWLVSPFKYMLDTHTEVMRRHLTGSRKLIDFKVLESFAAEGFTDYLAMVTEFEMPSTRHMLDARGLLVSWCTDRPGGFADDEIAALRRVQRRFAVACKSVIQARIARNIAETYLGVNASHRVLGGQIRLGDGETTRAVVLYSDLRRSTELADTLSREAFIAHLNSYFECVAGAAIACGGEVLDFIGDAVLAIFPLAPTGDAATSVRSATEAVTEGFRRARAVFDQRRAAGLPDLDYGVALAIGDVMFGNIGVPERLTFSVIGPTVNEVARIEKLTKLIGRPVLATAAIAGFQPAEWESVGMHDVSGSGRPIELFALQSAELGCRGQDAAAAADAAPPASPLLA